MNDASGVSAEGVLIAGTAVVVVVSEENLAERGASRRLPRLVVERLERERERGVSDITGIVNISRNGQGWGGEMGSVEMLGVDGTWCR